MTTANEQIATGVVGFAALVEMHFTTGVLRLSTLPQNIVWNTYTWTGIGNLGDIEEVKTTSNAEARSISLTLNISNPVLFAMANGGIDTYRGQDVNIYYAVMNPECTTILSTPRLSWFGVMDVVQCKVNEDGTGVVSMKCEPHSININRNNTKRVSNEQHQREFPGDLCYQYLEDLIGKPTVWLSKKFQQQ
jgi:hypothetical protein